MTSLPVLAEIRERLAKITPGPWFVERYAEFDRPRWQIPNVLRDRYGANAISSEDRATIEFVAAAPVDIADLTDALLAVLALADKWQGWGDRDPDSPVAAVFAGELRRAVTAHLDPGATK